MALSPRALHKCREPRGFLSLAGGKREGLAIWATHCYHTESCRVQPVDLALRTLLARCCSCLLSSRLGIRVRRWFDEAVFAVEVRERGVFNLAAVDESPWRHWAARHVPHDDVVYFGR